jgi:copper(I)-binding protein
MEEGGVVTNGADRLGFSLLLLAAYLLQAALLLGCSPASGPGISAEDVWARPVISMAETDSGEATGGGMGHAKAGTGAVYMLLVNGGGEPDRFARAATDVAEAVEIHETVLEGEVMKMQMLTDGLQIPAGGEVLLKPGSYHIMLIGMKRDLNPGDSFSLELEFEKAGSLTVEAEVREP